ncbi:hypothetical protein [Tabrizicola caldifontis]|uniref:hypothetical protein n=1 Tax=Tabrizicola caldifontis TaxID=2528036 RepID=UPI00143691DC|nr:hypothetical protein [Rhodobacter sp. YIM 73028]
MPQDRVVLCMKWGTLFPADYVNVLFRAASRHLTPGFRFICLTDRTEGLDSGIVTAPIPDIGLTPGQIRAPGVWRKLALFHPDVAALAPGARALVIDLDMVILGPLDQFFATKGGIILLDTGHDWRGRDPVQPSTGVFAFTLGEQHHILRLFQADPTGAMARFRNEQDFVAAHATDVSLWPTGAVISFKRHLARRYGRDLILLPPAPAPGPSILAFHGDPRPADLLRAGIWGRFPHVGRGPVGWLQEYWIRHGASLEFIRKQS